MEAHLEKRARKLVNMLENARLNCRLLIMQGIVVMRFPGAPFMDSPTMYVEADLDNAIELNLLIKQKMTGSLEWKDYSVKEKPAE